MVWCKQSDLNPVDYQIWGKLQERIAAGIMMLTS